MFSVGNKCDAPDKKVSTAEGDALAGQMDIPFFETSAKDNLNIETVGPLRISFRIKARVLFE